LLVGADKVADIVADDRIKAATLTGSEPAGASLAANAGKKLEKSCTGIRRKRPLYSDAQC
jgi:succinate-semialdehyde dehydrogenase/glutarate-semialdehyde dehydrogenase